ncbi:hypothetical protein LMG919_06315 [Xanthomonas vesicatoria]|nr:hypothetical protein LMG919_06315 [Xanthomonas vesicatoria]
MRYNVTLTTAAEAKKAAPAEANEPDVPMFAGFCAVTRALIDRYAAVAARSDVMLIDLRGNMGGFAWRSPAASQ